MDIDWKEKFFQLLAAMAEYQGDIRVRIWMRYGMTPEETQIILEEAVKRNLVSAEYLK